MAFSTVQDVRLMAQVALHSRRVMVKKHADGVIPKWLHWMKACANAHLRGNPISSLSVVRSGDRGL